MANLNRFNSFSLHFQHFLNIVYDFAVALLCPMNEKQCENAKCFKLMWISVLLCLFHSIPFHFLHSMSICWILFPFFLFGFHSIWCSLVVNGEMKEQWILSKVNYVSFSVFCSPLLRLYILYTNPLLFQLSYCCTEHQPSHHSFSFSLPLP